MIPLCVLTPLGDSVTWVSFMSAYALVLTLAGAEQAAEARVAAQDDPV